MHPTTENRCPAPVLKVTSHPLIIATPFTRGSLASMQHMTFLIHRLATCYV